MSDEQLKKDMLAAVDHELRDCVQGLFTGRPDEFREIITYQMGWEGKSLPGTTTGKRLRPLITLAGCHALGGDWRRAVPAAAAVELVHNFSLVHDDIQDHSETRRGKPTIWVKWGEAQAINAGDALLAAAFLEVQRLDMNEKDVLKSLNKLNDATLSLTTGQYLDLAFEHAESITLPAYWEMVRGKTGALFGVCFTLAAICAGKTGEEVAQYEVFGNQLGVAFQVQDDHLGIFGEGVQTGKSAASDLLERKKTFPILYALENLPDFRRYWTEHDTFSTEDVNRLKNILATDGIADVTLTQAHSLFEDLNKVYQQIFDGTENCQLLSSLVGDLFDRKS